MSKRDGKIIDGEVDLGNSPDFTGRSLLKLENLTVLIETIIENSRYTDNKSKARVSNAITALRFNSGFSSILTHLRELKRLRESEVLYEMDLTETNKQLFKRHVRNALDKGGHTLTVMIEMPDLPTPEKIVNPPENVELKMAYYLKNYDDDLRLKSAPHIRISGFELAREGCSGTGILFSETKGDLT